MATPIVIMSDTRSGSTALCQSLEASGVCKCVGEVFHTQISDSLFSFASNNYFTWLKTTQTRTDSAFHTDHESQMFEQKRLLVNFIRYLTVKSHHAYVFVDIKYNSCHHMTAPWQHINETPFMLSIIKEQRIPIIHLIRLNSVARALSEALAIQTGRWHVTNKSRTGSLSDDPVYLDPAEIYQKTIRNSEEVSLFRRFLRGYGLHIELYYETLFDTNYLSEHACERITKFLNLSTPIAPSMPIVKKPTVEKNQRITNLPTIINYFTGTPYEYMAMQIT